MLNKMSELNFMDNLNRLDKDLALGAAYICKQPFEWWKYEVFLLLKSHLVGEDEVFLGWIIVIVDD